MHDPGQLKANESFFFTLVWADVSPDFFEEPETFRPERFLENKLGTKPGADIKDFRDNFNFGAGRVKFFCKFFS